MDDGGLGPRDRVLRGILGALVGGGVGLLLMVDTYARPSIYAPRSFDPWLVPVIAVAASIGALLGYRSRL
ncbi:MAG TPA: hypothetical protein VFK78_08650 [Gemmatimonadales bacterium]|nr:hypothetical protein [Gemmatimonadales bacterium]